MTPKEFRPVIRVPFSQRTEAEEDEWWAAVAEELGFASLEVFDRFCGNLPAEPEEEVFQHEPE